MNDVWKWLIAGLAISLAGSLLHFVYDWSGKKKWVALLAAVNESTWEHLKLALLPTFLFFAVEIIARGFDLSMLVAMAGCVLVEVVAILGLFYGYRAFVSHSVLPIDISIFFIGVFAGVGTFYGLLNSEIVWGVEMWGLAGVVFGVIFVGYWLFTFFPPKVGLFKDPVCGGYGLHTGCGHSHRRKVRRKKK